MKKKTMLIIAAIVVVLILIAVAYKYRANWMPGSTTTKTAEQLAAEQSAANAAADNNGQSTSPYVQDVANSMAVDTSGRTVTPSSNAVVSTAVSGPVYKPPVMGATQIAAATKSAASSAVKYAAPNGGMQMNTL